MTKTQLPAAQDLSNEFVGIVRKWVDGTDCREIDRRNALPLNASACASHDFCDANQAMIDALDAFGVKLDLQNEEQARLISAAWGIAKASGFGEPE